MSAVRYVFLSAHTFMNVNWIPLFGSFSFADDGEIAFRGKEISWQDERQVVHNDGADVGLALCDVPFLGGTISVKVKAEDIGDRLIAAICLAADPAMATHLTAGLGSPRNAMLSVMAWDGKKWIAFDNSETGAFQNIVADMEYRLSATVIGQRAVLSVNGISVIETLLPAPLNGKPIGLYALSKHRVTFYDFEVAAVKPRAFVVMQFSSPFNELYTSVIKPICSEEKVEVLRVDEQFGPGMIIQDIVRHINEASVVIAEITPSNPNVYYEVGYAHAKGVPTILIAEEGIKLPFDVSPFRVLMYKNTIEGKNKIEAGLRAHLRAILKAGPEPR